MAKQKVTTLREVATRKNDQVFVDPRILGVQDGHNPRDYDLKENRAHLDELKASILENGVQQPLWVRLDKELGVILIVDGECRWRAVQELIEEGNDIKLIPVIEKTGTEQELLVQAMTANLGKPLSQWEVGGAYKRFISWGWTEAEIAKAMGQTETYVKQAIEFAGADKVTKKLLSQGAVTPSLALTTIKKHGDKASLILAEVVKKKAAQVAEESEKRKAAKAGKKEPAKKAAPKKEKPAAREKAVNSAHVKFKLMTSICEILDWVANGNDGDDADRGIVAADASKTLKKLLPKE